MDPSLPPDIDRRITALENRLANMERAQSPVQPELGALDNVEMSQAPVNGDVLMYNRKTGRWGPAASPGFVGEVVGSASGATPPGKWLPCNGAAANRADFPDLFAAIGTAYGAGNGSTTFNLPDFRGRFLFGAGNPEALGATGGARTHTLSTGELPSHSHVIGSSKYTFDQAHHHAAAAGGGVAEASNPNAGASNPLPSTSAAGSGAAHNNMPPFQALDFHIRHSL